MFANLLALPFVTGTLLFLYLSWTVDSDYAPWIIPFLVIAAFIFIMSPQINWWWYKRRPPVLSEGLRKLLGRFSVFYNSLSPADKKKFESRVALFRMGVEWTPIGWPDDITLPPDVELALASQAASLNFYKEELLFPAFEKVIIYPKPFPSPEHPYPHSSELYQPDGCLIFSAENVMRAFFNPGRFYNVGLHEYAKAFILANPAENWPVFTDESWANLETASGMSREHVESVVGLSGLEPLPIAIHHFFLLPEAFKKVFPVQYDDFKNIFSSTSFKAKSVPSAQTALN